MRRNTAREDENTLTGTVRDEPYDELAPTGPIQGPGAQGDSQVMPYVEQHPDRTLIRYCRLRVRTFAAR